MLLTSTIIISSLVFINLILLKFSCNKVEKSKSNSKSTIVLNSTLPTEVTEESLAPTGS